MNSQQTTRALRHLESGQARAMLRKHIHDVRNIVNCVGIEAALLNDDLKDDSAKESVGSIQKQLRELDGLLQEFSEDFGAYLDKKSGRPNGGF